LHNIKSINLNALIVIRIKSKDISTNHQIEVGDLKPIGQKSTYYYCLF